MQEEIRRKNAQERRAAQLSSGGNKLPAEAAPPIGGFAEVKLCSIPNSSGIPKTEEWFCTRCFRTSDHVTRQDAELELSQFECTTAQDADDPARE